MSEEPVRGEGRSPPGRGRRRALIRRTPQVTRRKFPAEEKIRVVLEGIRGEVAVSELCRREGIHPTIYYKWLKDFMEASKGRVRGDNTEILMLENFSFEKFLTAIEGGAILLDFDARTGHNYGTKFRLRQDAPPLLYETVVSI
jgi:transposase-like protein